MSEDRHLDDAAAWVLGALPDEDVARFRMRLRSDPELAAEVARLQPVADILPMAADQTEPPRELRARVMDVVWAEASRSLDAAAPGRGPLARFGTMIRGRPWYAAGLAAACLGIGIVVGVNVGGGATSTSRTIRASVTVPHVPNASASLVVDGGHAQLHVAKLPAPPTGHVYQVWVLHTGATSPSPTDALFKVSRDGSATVDVPGGVDGVQRVMVTTEPDGGSKLPTTAPIVIAEPS